jgi:hypothetical protein
MGNGTFFGKKKKGEYKQRFKDSFIMIKESM